MILMGKRGAKPKFTDISCPNQDCKFYGILGKGNIIGNGTPIKSRTREFENISATNAAEYSTIVQTLSLIMFEKMNLLSY